MKRNYDIIYQAKFNSIFNSEKCNQGVGSVDNIDKKVCIDSNEEAWNKDNYNAWVTRFGEPNEAIKKIAKDPIKTISHLHSSFGEVKGKKIMNLMGSNGTKAVALALLGAEVTVVDFSEENKRYAIDLARAGSVDIRYIVSDVLKLPKDEVKEQYDIVFAEMGILHYFSNLAPFMDMIYGLLKKEGIFVIRDFHPVSTKLISSRGSTAKIRKHKITGDYFDESLEEKKVSYSKYSDGSEHGETVLLRKWNLGEIVTSVAQSGLIIKSLTEEPNRSSDTFDKGIPKTFILVGKK